MFYDLHVPIPVPVSQSQAGGQSKKSKGKQPANANQAPAVLFSSTQITGIEARIDLLARLGYTVIALEHAVQTKYDPRAHENILDVLLAQLRKRDRVQFLKRLTIIMDDESDKGNGLSTGNAASLSAYDIISLHPTTQNSFQAACLTHSQPSTQTAHIISLPLTSPRLPFRLKHTLVKTAVKNGAVFEIDYSGALKGEDERRNWWTAAKELVRATKGKGLIASGGSEQIEHVRAPRDAENLIVMLGLAQNFAHDAMSMTPRSLLFKTQTRKTYRAVLSEPTLIIPSNTMIPHHSAMKSTTVETSSIPKDTLPLTPAAQDETNGSGKNEKAKHKKRALEQSASTDSIAGQAQSESKKKKKARLVDAS